MARIRSIKPELRTSITVSQWPREVRYFFVLLWGYLDDYGRGVDDDLLIASDCFPRDRDVTPEIVDGWLEMVADSGPLCRYEVDGRRYLHCPNWREHQKPQHPSKPRIPPCPDDEKEDFAQWRKTNPPRDTRRSRKSREGLTRSSNGFSGPSPTPSGGPLQPSFSMPQATNQGGAEATAPDTSTTGIFAGQNASRNTHEGFVSHSRGSTETLTPEQGAGSREQGSTSTSAKSRTLTPVTVDAAEPRDAETEVARHDVEKICRALADAIEANGSKRPTINDRWRTAARLMLDKDGRTVEQTLAAIAWCQADEFWRANILSLPKLREKYDTLRLQAQRQRGLAATGTSGGYSGWQNPDDQDVYDERIYQP